MKRYSTIMSVLLTLALPVAGSCADAPKAHDKADSSVEAVKKVDEKAASAVDAVKKTEDKAGAAVDTAEEKPALPAAAKKALTKAEKAAKAEKDAKKRQERADAIKDSMANSKHAQAMGGSTTTATGGAINPSGKVVETMNGGGYTYANLEKSGKQTWVAFPTLETRVGDTLSFTGCMEMPGFQSKALNHKFESIFFCGSPDIKSKPMNAKKSPGSGGATHSANKKISVEKADGANAYTVSEVFAKRDKLNGKHVVVRGLVVKVSTGIMNKNWIHLQDGTGSEKTKTHDLVVTSGEVPNEGDVVTASGTLVKDKDFGSGYKYSVMIEKASLKK